MSVKIHKQAVVDPKAEIGENCEVGPFCTIGANVKIGDGTKLDSHVVVDGHTTIGEECSIFPFATIGVQSQDQKYVPDTVTYCEIGSNNIFREFVSIHSGTAEGSKTVVGNNNAFLAHAHVAHNCIIGDHVVLSHSATVGGHVHVGDYANLGGLCAIHQYCTVGEVAMVAGCSAVRQDVLPYTIAEGTPNARMRVVNRVGMQRAGYSEEQIRDVRRAFRTLFVNDMVFAEAIKTVKHDLGHLDYIRNMLAAADESKRGLAIPDEKTFEINAGD